MFAKEIISEKELKIIDEILDWLSETGFFSALNKTVELNEWDNYNKWYNTYSCKLYDMGCVMDSGETKFVLLLYDFDWVIKINNPRATYNRHIKYAKKEANMYAAAIEKGLEKYFAPTYYYKSIEGIDITLQEYVDCDEDAIRDEFYGYCENDYNREEYETDEDYEWDVSRSVEEMDEYSSICALFGDVPELRSFINSNNINDLHAANFGYLGGVPVMIDYCGY